MTFNSNREVKIFVKELKDELNSLGENVLSDELMDWETNVYTTSSEFLGELWIILKK